MAMIGSSLDFEFTASRLAHRADLTKAERRFRSSGAFFEEKWGLGGNSSSVAHGSLRGSVSPYLTCFCWIS
jgi:hypothetical protein